MSRDLLENRPLVSILINNFNYAQFLQEAIDSAVAQSYPFVEVIVVDDGSTDSSREIINSYKNKIVKVFQSNRGQASAFNTGFAVSQGEIICFLDSDDVFSRTKLTEIVTIFTNYPQVDWCFHSLNARDKNTGKLLAYSLESSSRICDFRRQTKRGSCSFFAPATSGLCFKRSLLKQILPMAEELKLGPDRYLVNIAPIISPGYFLDRKLATQGIHGSNVNSLKEGRVFDRKRATRHVVVAYFIRLNFPQFKRFSNKIFARGISYDCYGFTVDRILRENKFFQKYLEILSWREKAEIWLIVFCRILVRQMKTICGRSSLNREMGLVQIVDG